MCLVKRMNITSEAVNVSALKSFINDKLLENDAYGLMNFLAATTGAYKSLGKVMEKFMSPSSKVNWSHRSFATQRTVKFYEMEYAVPLNSLKACISEMREVIKEKNFQTLFPIEIRFVEEDDLWLAPTFKQRVAYIAVHSYIKEDPKAYFSAMEKILQKFGGKAHWGKMNTMTGEYLENNYQRWGDFKELRDKLDPQKKFLNSYLEKLFS
jgi:FAD/FMN-containing dehydrogenase